jgi:hypothetical protein
MTTTWTNAVARLTGDLVDVAAACDICSWDTDREDPSTDRAAIRNAVWRMRRAYEEASEGLDVSTIVPFLAARLRTGREALIAWLDAIEEIVQLAERRYGPAPGQGEFKALQVKAAIRRLLDGSTARTAEFVELVGPSAVDLLTGMTIDVVVAILNTEPNVLWKVGDQRPRVPVPRRTRLVAFIVRVVSVPLSWFESKPVLDEELYDEVERIARAGADPLNLLDNFLGIGAWVVDHRKQTLALVDLVSAACDEVEYFTTLRGAEAKQAYARNLILIALEEAGIVFRGVFLVLAEAVIDAVIDLIVYTNNKRDKYQHSSR